MALLAKVRTRLALHPRKPVVGLFEGRNSSVLAGRSLDFVDLREYTPGDDIADVDWRASARHGGLLVKRYVADRKHTVYVAVDTGRELAALPIWDESFTKRDLAISVAGIFGWLAIKNGDYIGLVHLGADGPVISRPSTREVDLERMLELIEATSQPRSPNQDALAVVDTVISNIRRRAIVVLIVGDVDVNSAFEARLQRLVVQHEVVLITLGDVDPTEPGRDSRTVRDLGTGRRFPGFAATSAALAVEIAVDTAARADRRSALCAQLGVAHRHLTDESTLVDEVLDLVEGMRRVH
jgi:uncharacterized protein (DUF58 family)